MFIMITKLHDCLLRNREGSSNHTLNIHKQQKDPAMDTTSITIIACGAAVALVGIKDIHHIHKVIKERQTMYDALPGYEFESEYQKYMTGVLVSKEEHQKSIEDIKDQNSGVLGLTSEAYRKINRESVTMLGGPAAVLLQVAHPYIAYGIDQHSSVKMSPQLRFQKTFKYLFSIMYGPAKQSLNSARIVRALHDRVVGIITDDFGYYQKGHEYRADDLPALIWVMGSLVDIAVLMFEMIVRPLTLEEKDDYITDVRRGALFFGIKAEQFPVNWKAFVRYSKFMWQSRILSVSPAASAIQGSLIRGLAVPPPAKWMAALQIPPRLRQEFGFDITPVKYWVAITYFAIIRFVYRLLPIQLRSFPTFVKSLCRIEGNRRVPLLTKIGEYLGTAIMRTIIPGQADDDTDDVA